jgi:hypothetical protein
METSYSTQTPDLFIVLSWVPTGSDLENRVGDQDTGSPGRPVSSWLQVPVEPGIVVQEQQDPLGDLPAAFFLQTILYLYQQSWLTLWVYSLALWEIVSVEDDILIPKIEGRTFLADFCTWNFLGWGGVNRYPATPLIVPLLPITTGNHLNCTKQNSFKNCSDQMTCTIDVFIHVQAFRYPLRRELP